MAGGFVLDGMEEYLSEEDAVEVSAAMGSHDVVPTVLQKAFDLVDDFADEMDELAMSQIDIGPSDAGLFEDTSFVRWLIMPAVSRISPARSRSPATWRRSFKQQLRGFSNFALSRPRVVFSWLGGRPGSHN